MSKIFRYFQALYQDNWPWFETTVKLFIVAAIIGGVMFFIRPDLLQSIAQTFQQEFGPSPTLGLVLVQKIFLRNLIAVLIALFGGVLIGLPALIAVAVNGFILGFVVISLVVLDSNIFHSLGLIIGGILPHGVVEIPAFLLASGLGLRLGLEWLSSEAKNHRWHILKNNFKRAWATLFTLAVLLLVAAIVEVYISGFLVDKLK